MIKLKDILEGSAGSSYGADGGEPDTGFIHGGRKRKLGKLTGKPEPWFDNGGYTQLEFPEADHIMGIGNTSDYEVVKRLKEYKIKLKDILLESMSRNDIQSVIDRVYPQIVKNLGRAKRGTPKVAMHTSIYVRVSGIEGAQGEANPDAEYEWDKNEIYLYLAKMKNEEAIIRALLHEYTHATQDPKKMKEYRKLGYAKNPYEIAASKSEKNWKKYI